MRQVGFMFWFVSLVIVVGAACAQGGEDYSAVPVPPAETVTVAATDGLTLQGSYWSLPAESAPPQGYPAVLLLHMLGQDRDSWRPLVQPLLDAGFIVLAVDLRGHGETGGDRNWVAAQTDTQTWLDWLKTQPNVDSVSLVGGSIGANLALLGCTNDADCVTAVALAPGLDYQDLKPESAVVEGMAERSVLLVAAHGDEYSANSVRQMANKTRGEIGVRLFRGDAHGTDMFGQDYGARVITLVIDWLLEHRPWSA